MGERPIGFTFSRKSRTQIHLGDTPGFGPIKLPYPMSVAEVRSVLDHMPERPRRHRDLHQAVADAIWNHARAVWAEAVEHGRFPGSFMIWSALGPGERTKWTFTAKRNKGD